MMRLSRFMLLTLLPAKKFVQKKLRQKLDLRLSRIPFFYRQTVPVLLVVSRAKTPVIGEFCPQNDPAGNLEL